MHHIDAHEYMQAYAEKCAGAGMHKYTCIVSRAEYWSEVMLISTLLPKLVWPM